MLLGFNSEKEISNKQKKRSDFLPVYNPIISERPAILISAE
jgi:hypothetical protein